MSSLYVKAKIKIRKGKQKLLTFQVTATKEESKQWSSVLFFKYRLFGIISQIKSNVKSHLTGYMSKINSKTN